MKKFVQLGVYTPEQDEIWKIETVCKRNLQANGSTYVLSSHTYSVAVHIGSNGLTFDLNVPVSLYKIVLKRDFFNKLFFYKKFAKILRKY